MKRITPFLMTLALIPLGCNSPEQQVTEEEPLVDETQGVVMVEPPAESVINPESVPPSAPAGDNPGAAPTVEPPAPRERTASPPPEPPKPAPAETPTRGADGFMVYPSSGLKYKDEKVGTGPSPEPGQRVRVHYTGWLMNGEKFDSSRDRGEPFEFVLGAGEVIPGWDIGVDTMKVGGRRTLIIPPDLAYGATGQGAIPPDATLKFDVELLGVQ